VPGDRWEDRTAWLPPATLPAGNNRSSGAIESYFGEFSTMISIVKDLAAEALFCSSLQPSECPTRTAVEQAVTAMILLHGSEGCAAEVATEFGDHPDVAVRRMHWVHDELTGVVHSAAVR
jgi:hypothetical protein